MDSKHRSGVFGYGVGPTPSAAGLGTAASAGPSSSYTENKARESDTRGMFTNPSSTGGGESAGGGTGEPPWKRTRSSGPTGAGNGRGAEDWCEHDEHKVAYQEDGTPTPMRTSAQLAAEFDEQTRKSREWNAKIEADRRKYPLPVHDKRTHVLKPHALAARRVMLDVMRRAKNEKQKRQLYSLADSVCSLDSLGLGLVTEGEKRFERLISAVYEVCARNVDQHGETITLDPIQVEFIDKFCQSVASLVHKTDWAQCEYRFLKKHGLHRVTNNAMCLAPRRFGKTWAVVIFLAALLWTCPGIEIGVFSISQDISNEIVQWVRVFLSKMPNAQNRICNHSKGELQVCGEEAARLPLDRKKDHPSMSKLVAISSTAGRGRSFQVCVVDEIAYVKETQFKSVILPITQVKGSSIIGISTPRGSGNFYSKFFTMKDNEGNPMFVTCPVGMACEDCRKSGMASQCSHKLHLLPKWKTQSGQKNQKALQDDATYQEEALGLITDHTQLAFPNELAVTQFFERPTRRVVSARVVWLIIDPTGGGTRDTSEFSITAFVRDENQHLIVRHITPRPPLSLLLLLLPPRPRRRPSASCRPSRTSSNMPA